MKFILDGHNCLHRVPELKELMNRNILTAMQRLIGLVRTLPECTIIFDGDPLPIVPAGVDVRFANPDDALYERADEYIMQLVDKHKHTLVVTGDAALAGRLRQKRIRVETPEAFLKPRGVQSKPGKHDRNDVKKGPGGTPSEWVARFTAPRNENDDEDV